MYIVYWILSLYLQGVHRPGVHLACVDLVEELQKYEGAEDDGVVLRWARGCATSSSTVLI